MNNLLRFRVLFPLFWIAWILFHAWFLVFQGWDNNTAVTDSLTSNLLLMAISLGVFYSARYNRPGEKRIVYYLGGLLIAAAFSTWLSRELLSEILKEPDYAAYLDNSFAIRLVTNFLLIALFAMTGWIQQFVKEQQEEKQRQLETGRLAKESELLHLRRQLQPHFLFNTLNSVSALIGTDPGAARNMIQQLSDFLRSTVRTDDFSFVPLKDELRILQLYLEIEKVRFGNRLQVAIEISKDAENTSIPVFLLQPLVENAVKYGLYDRIDTVIISVACRHEDGLLFITISNPYDAATRNSVPGAGFGLESVKRRLFLLFNRNDLVEINGNENIFTVTLKIPQSG